jgi:hypothetical protein
MTRAPAWAAIAAAIMVRAAAGAMPNGAAAQGPPMGVGQDVGIGEQLEDDLRSFDPRRLRRGLCRRLECRQLALASAVRTSRF